MNAAGEWNFDMDAAPKDGTRLLLAWGVYQVGVWPMFYKQDDSYGNEVWTDGDGSYVDVDVPFAWASLNVPEVPK